MIKRTPQEIADFFGYYVFSTDAKTWYVAHEAPKLRATGWICKKYNRLPPKIIDVPSDYDWTHLYEPHNKSDACFADRADSDNKHHEYMIVTGNNYEYMNVLISNYRAEDGWRPQGGIYFHDGVFYQAMVRGI